MFKFLKFNAFFLFALCSIFSIYFFSQNAEAVSGKGSNSVQDRLKQLNLDPNSIIRKGDEEMLGLSTFSEWLRQTTSYGLCSKRKCNNSCKANNTGSITYRPGGFAVLHGAVSYLETSYINLAVFPSVAKGFFAHIKLLQSYCTNPKDERCTISLAINKWAPPSVHNNSTSNYIRVVSGTAKMPPHIKYSPNDISTIARIAVAMSCYENGGFPYRHSEIIKGLQMAGGEVFEEPSNVGKIDPNSVYSKNNARRTRSFSQTGGNYGKPQSNTMDSPRGQSRPPNYTSSSLKETVPPTEKKPVIRKKVTEKKSEQKVEYHPLPSSGEETKSPTKKAEYHKLPVEQI